MKSDTEIKHAGYQILFDNMDFVEAERFIGIMKNEKFDYTQWRRELWEDMTVEELSKKAMEHWKNPEDKS